MKTLIVVEVCCPWLSLTIVSGSWLWSSCGGAKHHKLPQTWPGCGIQLCDSEEHRLVTWSIRIRNFAITLGVLASLFLFQSFQTILVCFQSCGDNRQLPSKSIQGKPATASLLATMGFHRMNGRWWWILLCRLRLIACNWRSAWVVDCRSLSWICVNCLKRTCVVVLSHQFGWSSVSLSVVQQRLLCSNNQTGALRMRRDSFLPLHLGSLGPAPAKKVLWPNLIAGCVSQGWVWLKGVKFQDSNWNSWPTFETPETVDQHLK